MHNIVLGTLVKVPGIRIQGTPTCDITQDLLSTLCFDETPRLEALARTEV